MPNQISIIAPYWRDDAKTWMFDDPATGLTAEPFVLGIPAMIDVLVEGIRNAKQGFRLLFSAHPFPGWQKKLTWLREETGGNLYSCDDPPMQGRLCPALVKYFEAAPAKLYVRAECLAAETQPDDGYYHAGDYYEELARQEHNFAKRIKLLIKAHEADCLEEEVVLAAGNEEELKEHGGDYYHALAQPAAQEGDLDRAWELLIKSQIADHLADEEPAPVASSAEASTALNEAERNARSQDGAPSPPQQ